jgi:hypothetical protein
MTAELTLIVDVEIEELLCRDLAFRLLHLDTGIRKQILKVRWFGQRWKWLVEILFNTGDLRLQGTGRDRSTGETHGLSTDDGPLVFYSRLIGSLSYMVCFLT